MEDKSYLDNENCCFVYDRIQRKIFGRCLKDLSEPSAYSVTKRYLRKSWLALDSVWSPGTTYLEALKVIRESGTRVSEYYAQD